jgi:hypothetical protein
MLDSRSLRACARRRVGAEVLHSRAVRWVLPLVLVLTGCPPAPAPVDAGVEEDAGVDAGAPDAGRPPRDAGTPDAGFASAPAADWCRLRALAECSRDVRCGRLTAAHVPGCVLTRTTVASCDQLALARAVTEGRSRYDQRAALTCLNALASGSCEEADPSCAGVFTGLAPPDAGCILEQECDADGFCYLYDARCPHRCRGWEPLGSPCDGFTRRCDPRSAACDLDDAGVALCVPKRREGEACQRYDACGDALACTDGRCVARRAGPGEPCGLTNGFPYCADEYFCRQVLDGSGSPPPPGTCQRKAGLGGTCTGPGSCLPSLRCSALITTGVCLAKASLGAGCIAYDDCEDSLFCDAKSQRCETLPDAGGDCSFERTGYRCAPGTTCAFSQERCVAWKPEGADCGYGGECLSNECTFATLPDGGFGGTCAANCSQRADAGP